MSRATVGKPSKKREPERAAERRERDEQRGSYIDDVAGSDADARAFVSAWLSHRNRIGPGVRVGRVFAFARARARRVSSVFRNDRAIRRFRTLPT